MRRSSGILAGLQPSGDHSHSAPILTNVVVNSRRKATPSCPRVCGIHLPFYCFLYFACMLQAICVNYKVCVFLREKQAFLKENTKINSSRTLSQLAKHYCNFSVIDLFLRSKNSDHVSVNFPLLCAICICVHYIHQCLVFESR